MDIEGKTFLAQPEECPYLQNRTKVYRYSIIYSLTKEQLNTLLEKGWRHFGYTFFKPACTSCMQCIPVRIKTFEFTPSKSQRRTLRKNLLTHFHINELALTRRVYEIYENHSIVRFGEPPSLHFLISNVLDVCSDTYQVEYYYNAKLFAVDYIDETNEALSSIYCIYHSDFARLSPGIFSILKAIHLAQQKRLPYLYLGYYVPGCSVMEYKISFHPFEWFDWKHNQWLPEPIIL